MKGREKEEETRLFIFLTLKECMPSKSECRRFYSIPYAESVSQSRSQEKCSFHSIAGSNLIVVVVVVI